MDLSLLDLAGGAGILLGALASGVVGLGFPIVAVPLMTLAYGLETAVVVMTLPTLAIDFVNLCSNRKHREGTAATTFTLWAIVGAAAGVLIRSHLDEKILTILLGIVIALYLATQTFLTIDLKRAAYHPVTQVSAGGLAGLLQSAIGVSGPVVAIFFINRAVSREAFIFSAAVVFTVSGSVRATGLALTGDFTSQRLVAGVLIAVVALAVRTFGAFLGARMEPQGFRRAFIGVLAISLFFLFLKVL